MADPSRLVVYTGRYKWALDQVTDVRVTVKVLQHGPPPQPRRFAGVVRSDDATMGDAAASDERALQPGSGSQDGAMYEVEEQMGLFTLNASKLPAQRS